MIEFKRRPVVTFSGFWLIGIALMIYDYFRNPVIPGLHGTAAYGTTHAGELQVILLVTAAEVLISTVILRPWSYQHSWFRSLLTLILLTPWMLLWGALGLHAGPTTHMHSMWLLLYWVGLLVAAVMSGIGSFWAHRTSSEQAA
jgi:hypothetical protein